MMLALSRSHFLVYLFIAIVILILLHDHIRRLLWNNVPLSFQHDPNPTQVQPDSDPVDYAYNSTLGFEKVFYISMPHRTDRQDAMNLIAHSTNIDLTLEHGVSGKDIQPNARPEDSNSMGLAQLGSWRAHANVWSRLLSEKIETALILEDDADWDINVHDNFALLAQHMRDSNVLRKRDMTEYERQSAPYGLDWDVLYVGHCWDNRNDSDPLHIQYTDPDAPSRDEMGWMYRGEIESYGYEVNDDIRQRLVVNTHNPVCTIAYALTQAGAEKLLYNLGGYRGISTAVDLAIPWAVREGLVESRTVLPPLMVDFVLNEKSDINEHPVVEPIGSFHGTSFGLRNSARTELAKLFKSPKSNSEETEVPLPSGENAP